MPYPDRMWRIGELARETRLTFRTLHHYDHLGLLSPGTRTGGKHRCYRDDDVRRLHRIGALRSLGLPLEDIATLLGRDAEPSARAITATDSHGSTKPSEQKTWRTGSRYAVARRRAYRMPEPPIREGLQHIHLRSCSAPPTRPPNSDRSYRKHRWGRPLLPSVSALSDTLESNGVGEVADLRNVDLCPVTIP